MSRFSKHTRVASQSHIKWDGNTFAAQGTNENACLLLSLELTLSCTYAISLTLIKGTSNPPMQQFCYVIESSWIEMLFCIVPYQNYIHPSSMSCQDHNLSVYIWFWYATTKNNWSFQTILTRRQNCLLGGMLVALRILAIHEAKFQWTLLIHKAHTRWALHFSHLWTLHQNWDVLFFYTSCIVKMSDFMASCQTLLLHV